MMTLEHACFSCSPPIKKMYSPLLPEYIFSRMMSSLKHVLALFPSVSVYLFSVSLCVNLHVVGGCVCSECRVRIICILFGDLPMVSSNSQSSLILFFIFCCWHDHVQTARLGICVCVRQRECDRKPWTHMHMYLMNTHACGWANITSFHFLPGGIISWQLFVSIWTLTPQQEPCFQVTLAHRTKYYGSFLPPFRLESASESTPFGGPDDHYHSTPYLTWPCANWDWALLIATYVSVSQIKTFLIGFVLVSSGGCDVPKHLYQL